MRGINSTNGYAIVAGKALPSGAIDDCKTNVQVSLFRANFEKCFVSGHDFSRAEKGPVGRGL
jgi:hypothetical protein